MARKYREILSKFERSLKKYSTASQQKSIFCLRGLRCYLHTYCFNYPIIVNYYKFRIKKISSGKRFKFFQSFLHFLLNSLLVYFKISFKFAVVSFKISVRSPKFFSIFLSNFSFISFSKNFI